MIGILFATGTEAHPFIERGVPEDVVLRISGMGMEAALLATQELIEQHGCTTIINAGVCGALNNRVERSAVYRVSMVSTEKLKAAINVGIGVGLKKLVTVDEPVFQPDRRKELSKNGELVDMEGYAVARVCEEHGVPCIMLKGVTDFGDGNGKADIKKWTSFSGKVITRGDVLFWPPTRLSKEFARHQASAGSFQRVFKHLSNSGYRPKSSTVTALAVKSI